MEDTLIETSKHCPVYVKDICYSSIKLLKTSKLLHNPNVHFLFLVRDPYDQLVSLCKQFNQMKVPPKMVTEVYDYQILLDLIQTCRIQAPNRTIVMETECLCQYPEKMMRVIAKQAGLNFPKIELTWNRKSENFTGEEWHETKKPQSFRDWHSDAINSTGFRSLPTYQRDWSQFPDVNWAQQMVASNQRAYHQIFN